SLQGRLANSDSLTFVSNGRRLARIASDETVSVWDLAAQKEAYRTRGGQCLCLASSPDGATLAAGYGRERTLKLWDAATGSLIREFAGHNLGITCVAFRRDGKQIVSAGFDKTLRVWETQTGRQLLVLEGHTAGVRGVAFSPDDKRIASAGEDKSVKIWDAGTGQLTLDLPTSHAIYCMAFSPDGQRIAVCGASKTV